MKVYKHDRYDGCVLLTYPACGHILGVPFHESTTKNKWVRSGIGIANPDGTHDYTALPRNRRAAIKEIFDGLKQGFVLTIKDYKGE